MKPAPKTIEQQQAEWLSQLRGKVAVRLAAALRQGGAATVAAVDELERAVDQNLVQLDVTAAKVRQQGVLVPMIACKKGCSYCCHGRVTTSIPEVMRIAAVLRANLSGEDLAELVTEARTYLAEFEGLTAYERSVHAASCLFLDGQGECSIHPLRPIACRRHHSLDVAACEKGLQDLGATRVPQITQHATVTQPIVDGIDLGTRSAGLVPRRVELVAALLLALTTDAEVRWLAGEDPFAPAEDRELLELAARSATGDDR